MDLQGDSGDRLRTEASLILNRRRRCSMADMVNGYEIRWAEDKDWIPAMHMIWKTFLKYEAVDYTEEGIRNFHEFLRMNTSINVVPAGKISDDGGFGWRQDHRSGFCAELQSFVASFRGRRISSQRCWPESDGKNVRISEKRGGGTVYVAEGSSVCRGFLSETGISCSA